jgi:hypothetical protein
VAASEVGVGGVGGIDPAEATVDDDGGENTGAEAHNLRA